jgi:DHA2 family lincomycin resistance protein-like MFS transporter
VKKFKMKRHIPMIDEIHSRFTEKQRTLIMLPILLSGFIAALNETLLNVAFPQLMSSLKVTTGTIQWLSTIYMLTIGIMVPIVAFLLQSIKTKTLFLSAMLIFTIGTLSGALAQTFSALLISRIVQGIGAGILLTMIMGVIVEIYPVAKRGAAMGTGIMIVVFAPAIGPTLSGIILQYLNWHWLFLIVLPFAIVAIILGIKTIENVTTLTKPKIDVLSIALSTIGFGGLIFGISVSESSGLNTTVLVSLVCGIIGLIIFIKRQFHLKQPLLQLQTLRYPTFSLGIAIVFITFMIPIATSIILPIFMQRVMGLTPIVTGLALLPGNIFSLVAALIAGWLFDKIGAKKISIAGYLILIIGLFCLSRVSLSTTLFLLIIFHCCVLISIQFIIIPIQTNSLNQLPQEYNPHGVGISNTALQLGGAFGSAIFIGLMGAIEGNKLAGLKNPTIYQIHSAIVSSADYAFLAALAFVVIGLVLVFFINSGKKTNGIPLDTGKE